MEEINKLTKRIENVNNDDKVIKDWMIEDNSRWYVEELQDDSYLEGMEEGKKLGIESNKIEMIKSMLKENYEYQSISKITGKSIEEIKEIEDSMKEKE